MYNPSVRSISEVFVNVARKRGAPPLLEAVKLVGERKFRDLGALLPGTARPRTEPERTNKMFKRKVGIVLAAGLLVAGLGVASAFAGDHSGAGTTSGVMTTTSTNTNGDDELSAEPGDEQDGQQDDEQDGEQGDDEQGAVDDVAEAATDVQVEANSTSADDESGDQHDEDDDSEEPGDTGQGD
jgi:hypothetical protein